ncbi:YbjN domain-containing protein [Streptomyces sp. x-80]|uniref:YbjN domain-containing protein n=1 Tax=Streptomyces sp. x-80 TaxID=2789282 RepID=UPI00397F0A09
MITKLVNGSSSMPLSDTAAPQQANPVVLNQSLVEQLLDQMGIKHTVDSEGDLVAGWDGFRTYFMFHTEGDQPFFAIRTFYDRRYSAEDREQLFTALNAWNRRSLWPKAYVHTHEDGTFGVIGEIHMLCASGVFLDHFAPSLLSWVTAPVELHTWLTDEFSAVKHSAPAAQ